MSGLKYDSDLSDTNSNVYLSGTVTVTVSGVEAKVGSTSEENRQFVRIYNKGNQTVYFGPSGLNFDDMEPLFKKQSVEIAATNLIEVFLKTETGTSDVIVQEIG